MTAPSSELTFPDLELIRPLGRGQGAEVYLAREPELKRLVAVKVLRAGFAADETARRRFEREAVAVAALNHPGIVQLYRVGRTADGRPFLVMQYVNGRSVEERLAAEGTFSPDEARRILTDVAAALATAHRQGIVHRDLRPSNVLIEDETGRVMLADFGMAAILDTGTMPAPRITRTGQLVGDGRFMSPEQIRGEKVTGQADVYQLGVLAYHMLTGEGPFGGGPVARLMAAHLKDEARELIRLRPVVDAGLSELARRCLAKEASRRPTSADLVRRLSAPPGQPQNAAWPEPIDLMKRRIPQFVVAAAIVGASVLGGVSQLTEHRMLPEISYPLTLIFVVHGVATTAVISWFHGERGRQRVVSLEIAALIALAASWVAWSVWTILR